MLDNVRERLLDDPVEGGLNLARQPLLAELRFEIHLESGLLAEAVHEPLHCGHQSEVVERRRSKLDRKATDVPEGRDDELTQRCDRGARVVRRRGLFERLETEQNRRERLSGLVVQLAGESSALELLRLDDPAYGIPAHPFRELDGNGRAGC